MRKYDIRVTDEQGEYIDRLIAESHMTATAYVLSLLGLTPARRVGRPGKNEEGKNNEQ